MDSTQSSFISNINNYIPLFALLVSISAIIISYKAFKKSDKILAPRIAGRYTRGHDFILHIQDFLPSKNLRIDSVFYKPLNKLKYFKIDFEENRLPNQTPPVLELLLTDELVHSTGIIKVKTSVITLYEFHKGLLYESKSKWYQIVIKFNCRNFNND